MDAATARAARRLTRHQAEVLDGIRRRDARHRGGALFCACRPRRPIDQAIRRRRPVYGIGSAGALAHLAAKGYLVLEGEVGAVALFSLVPSAADPHRAAGA